MYCQIEYKIFLNSQLVFPNKNPGSDNDYNSILYDVKPRSHKLKHKIMLEKFQM